MNNFSTGVQQIKYEVLKEVAYLAFKGKLKGSAEEIPYKIIPGSRARFRCCVYREREIVRQRVKMAMGIKPYGSTSNGIIHVISAACEGCPIHRFQVTENCQQCVAKKCQKACPFGAITVTDRRAYIDHSKCRECGRCRDACPYNAIAELARPCIKSCPVGAISKDEEKKAVIDESKCISCGACTRECPFGAIEDISFMVDVIEEIRSGRKVIAVFAPSIEGQFGDRVSIPMIKRALVKLGFYDAIEVALGADAVAIHEANEAAQKIKNGEFITTSCCPAFVAMIKKHYPKLKSNISGTVSPMIAVSRLIKRRHPDAVVVFIGPCIAKKVESMESDLKGGTDYVITFEELAAMLDARGIGFGEEAQQDVSATFSGRGFAISGGVAKAVMRAAKEEGIDARIIPLRCNGADECKKMLFLAGAGKLTGNFIEGMACREGCVGGPAVINESANAKKIMKKNAAAGKEDKSIKDTVRRAGFDGIDLKRKDKGINSP